MSSPHLLLRCRGVLPRLRFTCRRRPAPLYHRNPLPGSLEPVRGGLVLPGHERATGAGMRTLSAQPLLLLSLAGSIMLCGCSAVGYGLGGAAGAVRRHDVPIAEAGSLKLGRYVWADLHSGERIHGRLRALSLPDSLSIQTERMFSDAIPGYRPDKVRSVPLSQISRLQASRSAYRWVGLGLGAAIDVGAATYVLTRDTSFKPHSSKSGLP
jgi:hypothetical protein